MKNNYNTDKKISYICEYEWEYFLNKNNVVGVALGYKKKNDFNTYKKCITVFVTKKISSNKLNKDDLIPSIYKSFPTDVIESGVFTSSSFYNKVRPVVGGYMIGNELDDNTGGTLGCLVTDGQYKYLLSNNHVIAMENSAPLNSRILQPCIGAYGNPKKDTIAILSKFTPFKYKSFFKSPSNYVDCAMAKIISPSLVSNKIALVGSPKGTIIPQLNKRVKKVGATSELTYGVIENINGTTKVEFPKGPCLFKKQIFTTSMMSSGDSGSILLDDNNYAVGLHMASNPNMAIVNPINLVLDALKVNLVTD